MRFVLEETPAKVGDDRTPPEIWVSCRLSIYAPMYTYVNLDHICKYATDLCARGDTGQSRCLLGLTRLCPPPPGRPPARSDHATHTGALDVPVFFVALRVRCGRI